MSIIFKTIGGKVDIRTRKNTLNEKEMELVKYLMPDCRTIGDIQEKLKRLFAGTIERMLEAEMEEYLGWDILGTWISEN